MKEKSSRGGAIRAMVGKDLKEYSRDKLWMIMVPISLVFMIALFWILPKKVNETITVGVSPSEFAQAVGVMGNWDSIASSGGKTEVPGIQVLAFEDESELSDAVFGKSRDSDAKKIAIGIAFPSDFITAVGSGEPAVVSIYMDAAVPELIGHAVISGIRELAYALRAVISGRNPLESLPVALPELRNIILGEDRAGIQIPLREKLRPLMVVLILLIEALVLAGLVAVEIEHRTVTALLVTPARTGDVLAAKCITGAVLALSQGLLFLLLTQSFRSQGLLVLVLTILGAFMASAVGMIAGAAGRDFMGTLFVGMIFIVPLMVPAFTIIIPGSPAWWVKALPSYGLIKAMVGTIGYGEGWREAMPHIIGALAWGAVLFGTGLIVLKRRVETL